MAAGGGINVAARESDDSGDGMAKMTLFNVIPRGRQRGIHHADNDNDGSRVSTRPATRPAGCVEGRLTQCRDDVKKILSLALFGSQMRAT